MSTRISDWGDLYHFDGKAKPNKIGQFDGNYWATHGGMTSVRGIDFGDFFFKEGYPCRTLIAKYVGTYEAAPKLEIVRLFAKNEQPDFLYHEVDEVTGARSAYVYVTDKTLEEVRAINSMVEKNPFFRELDEETK